MGRYDHTHERISAADEVKASSNRQFGIVIGAACGVIALLPVIGGEMPAWWVLIVAAVLVAAALIVPDILGPFNRIWTKFGLLLHMVTSPVIMGLMFFLVISPIGLLLRLFNKDVLRLRCDSAAASYWIERRPPGPEPKTMSDQF